MARQGYPGVRTVRLRGRRASGSALSSGSGELIFPLELEHDGGDRSLDVLGSSRTVRPMGAHTHDTARETCARLRALYKRDSAIITAKQRQYPSVPLRRQLGFRIHHVQTTASPNSLAPLLLKRPHTLPPPPPAVGLLQRLPAAHMRRSASLSSCLRIS